MYGFVQFITIWFSDKPNYYLVMCITATVKLSRNKILVILQIISGNLIESHVIIQLTATVNCISSNECCISSNECCINLCCVSNKETVRACLYS